jgi:hypothetical protein
LKRSHLQEFYTIGTGWIIDRKLPFIDRRCKYRPRRNLPFCWSFADHEALAVDAVDVSGVSSVQGARWLVQNHLRAFHPTSSDLVNPARELLSPPRIDHNNHLCPRITAAALTSEYDQY